MAKTNVLMRPKVDIGPSRNDFDRGFTSNFNQSAGMILPVFAGVALAGSDGVINARRFTRTAQVVNPAFQTVTQHIDFFKIPIRLLWSYWKDFKTNTQDINSTLMMVENTSPTSSFPNSVPNYVPRWNLTRTDVMGHFNSSYAQSQAPLTYRQSKLRDLLRLTERLDYGDWLNVTGSDRFVQSIFLCAAYQKCYYDKYRNSLYENNDPFAYNLDWLSMDDSNGELLINDSTKLSHWLTFEKLTTLRYVNYRNDYFHNIYPSLNYSVTVPSGLDWHLPSDVSGVSSPLGVGYSSQVVDTDSSVNPAFQPFIKFSYKTDNSAVGNFSNAQSLRALFALDKLMRASARAPKHVADQIEARFGVKATRHDKALSNECEHIGSFINDIVFGEVTNTAASASNPLGEIGGKGIGSGDFQNDIHFSCGQDDCIILGLQFFIPRASYDASGVGIWNCKLTRNEFFQPEFEHLGLRPLYGKELQLDPVDFSFNNKTVGFKQPNQEYKLGIDKNYGLFRHAYFDISINEDDSTLEVATKTGTLQSFVIHNNEVMDNSGAASLDYFKVRPSDIDYIFASNYTGDQISDQFYGYLRFKFKVNVGMSVFGEPVF